LLTSNNGISKLLNTLLLMLESALLVPMPRALLTLVFSNIPDIPISLPSNASGGACAYLLPLPLEGGLAGGWVVLLLCLRYSKEVPG
jgi:hypothetical protein